MEERIQKILSAAGIASRRAAEEIILEGRVRVNGKVVSELGAKADPDHDHIKVDGKLINPKQPKAYIMLNKPAGFVTTMSDPEGRPIVANLLKGVRVRVYPVGRLDYDTEGLLLLTNDGDLAHLVTHPKHELPKTYLVKVKGFLEDRHVEMLEQGVFLKDGKTAPARVRKLRKEESNSWVEITIHEGRKRQVRRMIDHTGHSVIKLKRTRVGSLSLGDLPVGVYRHLTLDEVQGLRDMATQEEAKRPAPRALVQKQNEEARTKMVRREAGDARKRDVGHDDTEVWGRGEEKRRSRGHIRRDVASMSWNKGERPAAVTSRQRTPWQGKEKDRTARWATGVHRQRSTGDRSPAFAAPRPATRPPWKEQHDSSRGSGRPHGERPRTSGVRATDQRGPRPDLRGPGAGGRGPVRDEKRAARPAFVGKVYGSRKRGPVNTPGFKPAGQPRTGVRPSGPRPAGPRLPERGTRAAGREPGRDEKRTSRPVPGGKVYGTGKPGPVNSPGFKPGGPRRAGTRPSGPRPSSAGGQGGRRS
jgi:23S rRNA pseudouridine2605 synthase